MGYFLLILYYIAVAFIVLVPVGMFAASCILFFILLYPVYILSEEYYRDLLGKYITFGAHSLAIYNIIALSMDRQNPHHRNQ